MIKKFLIVVIVLLLLLLLLNKTGAETKPQPIVYEFGNYWQTYEVDGEKSPLEWFILDETEEAILLITRYSVDASIYNPNDLFTTWENSTAREFLNTYFYDECFSEEEKARILLTKVEPHINIEHPDVGQGVATEDYVFLLSAEEANRYFEDDDARIAAPTPFAQLGHVREFGKYWAGAYTDPSTGACCWRLRTAGWDNYHVCAVLEDGFIALHGDILHSPHYAVRPCVWVKKL